MQLPSETKSSLAPTSPVVNSSVGAIYASTSDKATVEIPWALPDLAMAVASNG